MARRKVLTRIAILLGVVAVLGFLLPPNSAIIWDGIWEQEEYRITFTDRDGKPVKGVELRVENESGINFYHFPIADYLPKQVPTSGADGVLVFHHVPSNSVSGRDWWLFGVIPMSGSSPPVYVCRFLLHEREVHRIRYNHLLHTGKKLVKRRWKWLTWPELEEAVFQSVEWDGTADSRLRLFDFNGNGKLDRDEQYAAAAAERAQERSFEIMDGNKPEWEELELMLVERTVVLDLP
jgi:hypothetical protein